MSKPSPDRIKMKRGKLDEIVLTGTAHLEQMDTNHWFLSLYRPDGTGYGVWLYGRKGRIDVSWEER